MSIYWLISPFADGISAPLKRGGGVSFLGGWGARGAASTHAGKIGVFVVPLSSLVVEMDDDCSGRGKRGRGG